MLPNQDLELSVSEFVALLNQTLEFAYPSVVVHGELANLRVSKNRWVYFDLKDEDSTVKFFGTVYQLPGPLEDGMMLKVRGTPKLHNLYGFSVNVLSIQPQGEGTIRRAAELLQAKLSAEGLFDPARKRSLPYPPSRIGLITSKQSAAYADFVKILNARWRGIEIDLIDVQVQGEIAPSQIVKAIEQFNAMAQPPEVLILIRGGGSAEDLAAFSTEAVTRSVAASRVPTLVAIGHEVDLSLAELAADLRASTPSNAAEFLVPDRQTVIEQLGRLKNQLEQDVRRRIANSKLQTTNSAGELERRIKLIFKQAGQNLSDNKRLLQAFSPDAILRRGYSIVRTADHKLLRSSKGLKTSDIVSVKLASGQFEASVTNTKAGK